MALASIPANTFARAFQRALDIVFPPRCLNCGTEVEAGGALCAGCWPNVRFIAEPLCARCGVPFPFDVGADAICGACLADPPDFDRARAVFVYDEHSRDLVLSFKHADATEAAPGYGAWLARAGRDLLAEADMLVPVPLHRGRLFARRYNQAALLVHAISKTAGVAAVPDALVRVKRTRPHIDMGRSARLRNVAGAFAVHPGRAEAARGARILLVDDVLTTGATVSACARVLKRAGAARVDVLALARVSPGT